MQLRNSRAPYAQLRSIAGRTIENSGEFSLEDKLEVSVKWQQSRTMKTAVREEPDVNNKTRVDQSIDVIERVGAR